MNRLFIIILLLGFLTPVYSQKKRINKEELLKEQGRDDVASLSKEEFPNVEKFHLAVREMRSKNYTEAKELFNEYLQAKPNDDAAYFALGEISRRQNLNSEALKHYLKAQKIDPDNIHYTQEIAFLQFEKAQFDEAVVNFEKLTNHEPRQVEWLYAYGQTLLYTGDYEKALDVFNKLQDQMGPVPEITMIKIDLLKELKQDKKIEAELLLLKKAYPQDLEILKNVIGYYEEQNQKEKAIALIKELVDSEPENGVAHFILAKDYFEKGEVDSYLKSLKIVAESPEIKVEDKLILSKPVFTLDPSYDEEVYGFSSKLAETHPDNPKALILNAEILNNLGRTREALAEYRKATDINETEYRLWTSVLAYESAHKDFKALYEDAQKAIEFFPSLPFVYFSAAEGAMHLEKYDEALEFLEMGEMYIIDDPSHEARFAMRYGEVFFRQNKPEKGIKAFETALSKEGSPLINLSFAYHLAYSKTELAKALNIAEKLFDKEPKTSKTYSVLAYVYFQKEEYQKTIKLLQKGVEEVSYKAELYDLLGDAYFKADNLEEAKKYWLKAKESESRNSVIKRKIEEEKYYAPKYY